MFSLIFTLYKQRDLKQRMIAAVGVRAQTAVTAPAKEPTFTAEGFELSVGTNHLGHFLLARLLLDDLKKSDYSSKRLIIGDLRGMAGDLKWLNSSPMIDGGEFDGAKAYKDSKVCNMLTMQEFHMRFHEEMGIAFTSLYPGCIATTGLFREHIPLFRLLFPPFQKYITKGYVSEEESNLVCTGVGTRTLPPSRISIQLNIKPAETAPNKANCNYHTHQ